MKFVSLIILSLLVFAGCTYSKKEVDYPTPASCDIANVKYSTTIKPILDASCNRCHSSGSGLGGGYVFDTYAGVKDELDNAGDELLKAIKHIGPVTPMPKDGGKLSDCEIAKIEAWINQGYPNN